MQPCEINRSYSLLSQSKPSSLSKINTTATEYVYTVYTYKAQLR